MTQNIHIISGSTLGTAEIVAETISDYLKAKDVEHLLHHSPSFETIEDATHLVVCCATHGAGEYPDLFQGFVQGLQKQGSKLTPQLKLLLIGLGSTDYDTYCNAIVMLEQEFAKFNIQPVAELLKIDCSQSDELPEDLGLEYFKTHELKFFN